MQTSTWFWLSVSQVKTMLGACLPTYFAYKLIQANTLAAFDYVWAGTRTSSSMQVTLDTPWSPNSEVGAMPSVPAG